VLVEALRKPGPVGGGKEAPVRPEM